MKKKAVIIGASFNPVHNGHLAVAQAAMAEPDVERVIMLPCGQHAFGKVLAPKADRLQMLELAQEEVGATWEIDRREIESEETSYTYQTLVAWQKDNPDWQPVFILGSENLADFHKWYQVEKLVKEFEIWVTNREEREMKEELKKWGGRLKEWRTQLDLSAQNLQISSTLVREKAARQEKLTDLVPTTVAAYIKEKGFYE